MDFLYRLSQRPLAWGVLSFTAFSLEACALFFQHVLGLSPCVMCVYERLAVLGVLMAGLSGMAMAYVAWGRWISVGLWLYGAISGLLLSFEHVGYQMNPSPFNQCSPFPNFPTWLPLDRWLPWMFHPDGDCSLLDWHFLSLSMPQWLVIIFGVLSLIAVMILLSFLWPKRLKLVG
jgi:disulfide bond formation protein DsbB